MNTRKVAHGILLEVYAGQSLNAVMPKSTADLAGKDKGFVQELVYSALRYHGRNERVLSSLLSKPLRSKDRDIKCLLHVGLAQLLDMRVPDHAAINTSVGLVPKKKAWAKGMVNAVLRRVARDIENPSHALLPEDAFPEWLYKFVKGNWPDDLEKICNESLSKGPMTLRVNQQLSTPEVYKVKLDEAGIESVLLEGAAIRLMQAVAVSDLPGFDVGEVSVQDVSAQQAARILSPSSGMKVLDACAAPGGKTCHLWEVNPDIALTAIDLEPSRLDRVKENIARIGVKAKLQSADIRDVGAWWDGELFDQILLDAPCSATGVVRRNPDIGIHRRPDDIAPLVELQAECLDALWATLKPGGALLYATCSILKAENQHQVSRFLERTADASLEVLTLTGALDTGSGSQFFPGGGLGGDGFFYAKILKQG